MKTTLLTLSLFLVLASAFCQTKTDQVKLNMNYEMCSENEKPSIVHFKSVLSFNPVLENVSTLRLTSHFGRIENYHTILLYKSSSHLSVDNNNLSCKSILQVENESDFLNGFRVRSLVTPIENEDGSMALQLMGGVIKYSQFRVIKGAFAWDSEVYRH